MERVEGRLVFSHYNEIVRSARAVNLVAGLKLGDLISDSTSYLSEPYMDSWSGGILPVVLPDCEELVLNCLRYYGNDRRGWRRFSIERSNARDMLDEIGAL